MATTTTQTVFVIKNQDGHFLEYQNYSGLRSWTPEYSDRCAFPNQFAATLYCRSLMADAELRGLELSFDVYQINNSVKQIGVTIADDARANYGLGEKAEVTAETEAAD